MEDCRSQGRKPYTLYQSGVASNTVFAPPEGLRQSRERRRRRRAARRRRRILILAISVIAALLLVLVSMTQPWIDKSATASARTQQEPNYSVGGSPSPSPSAAAAKSTSGSPSEGSVRAAGTSPTPAASPDDSLSVTVTGGGDVIGDRSVRTVLAREGAGLFDGVASIFNKSDFGFVNLETPLTTAGEPQTWKDVVFKGDPRLADAMAASGINVVTLANNHAGDQGDSGLLDTLAICAQSGITAVGAGVTLAEAQSAKLLKSSGAVRVAFLGFSDVLPQGYGATSVSPGTSPGRSDLVAVTAAITAASCQADFTIVAWHWNLEFATAPTSLEAGEARAAVDAGADVVFAHHPHVLQGVQAYNGALICYSLGDLVFDNCTGPMAQTVLVTTRISPTRIEATLVPVQIASSGKPSIATGAVAASILERVKTYSATLGTQVRIANGKGHVTVSRSSQ
ncbi:MAG: CapA family protein [Thermoleophilia bacterium]